MDRRTFLAGTAALTASATLPGPVAAEEANLLLADWTGPYGGVPPFGRVRVADLLPALRQGIALETSEIDAITASRATPTFENTIAALQRSGRPLERVSTIIGIWSWNFSTPEFQAIESEAQSLYQAHQDRISQNEALFRRVDAVYQARERSNLTPEQQRLTWLYWTDAVRNGARLAAPQKARLAYINQELAARFTRFTQNLLADEAGYVTLLSTPEDLAGLPEDVRGGARAAAAARGEPDKWAILNTRSSVEPFLTFSTRRDLRERVWRNFTTRCDHGDERDNKRILAEILQLRAERAALLGFPTHAHWRLRDNSVADTPEAALELMMRVWPAARARIAQEVTEMQAIADREGGGVTLQPWDYRYYAEKVRVARYDLDMNEVKPYLQLDKMREGMFWAAGQLYGLTFQPVDNVPTAHPDIKVWEVKGADGGHVGLWYFDPYARVGKRSGAWMNAYRAQSTFDGPVTTLVSNNSNFVPGAPGEPLLISWGDAVTLFHEFGHALHGLLSAVTYPGVSGTRVARDYVEFPSQINEHWLPTREVLSRFALHYQTGQPMPAEMAERIERTRSFNTGWSVGAYIVPAIIDMRLHMGAAGAPLIDPASMEEGFLADLGVPPQLESLHRIPHFRHIFASDGYSAGYYSYIWSEVMALDAVEAFKESPGGLYDRPTAERLRRHIMSTGNAVDPAENFRRFRGRDPDVGAYLRDKGFPAAGATSGA